MIKKYTFFLLCICSFPFACMAEEASLVPALIPAKTSGEIAPADIITKNHTITIGNEIFNYESQVGTLTIKGDDGKDRAHIFFTAYFAKDVKGPRPITFCFNGGPGSSSIWLHIGFLGPKRVVIQDEKGPTGPAHYQDNPFTLLKVSDLVFIDPVSAGFSKAADGVEGKTFFGVGEDIDCFANFIRSFISYFKRWDSPKYLLGESYGVTRAIGLAQKLFDNYCISLNGLVLISGFDGQGDSDLTYSLTVPTYAATAWYHKKLALELQAKELEELLKEVEQFCLHDLNLSFCQGDKLSPKEQDEIAQKLSYYTGLSKEYILRDDLRVPPQHFFKELLRAEGKVCGRFDSRYVNYDLNCNGEMSKTDPSYDFIAGQFTSAHQTLLLKELGWNKNDPYWVISSKVQPWNWASMNTPQDSPAYEGWVGILKMMMTREPNLKVFLVEGYYDLAGPYFNQDYTFTHLRLPTELQKNILRHIYKAGHMPYLHEESFKALSQDLEKFIAP